MLNKSALLRQMRKHAKTFSSAIRPPKAVDEASLNHALGLIDLITKESSFGTFNKFSLKIPSFLKALRLENNLDFLSTEVDKDISKDISKNILKNKRRKEKDKFKSAENKLKILLSTKDC